MKAFQTILRLFGVFSFLQNVVCIDIVRLLVPKLVEDGKKGPFDLECNYRCGEGDEQLVVKWFFNNETTPFYQWIAGVGEPIISGAYHHKFSFEEDKHADTCNNKVSYRLILTEPQVAMSGLYRCEVQTYDSQDSAEANMVVFSPPRNFSLVIGEPSPGTLAANCTVSPVYPIPEMKIFLIHKTDKEERHPFEDANVESIELEGRVHRVSLIMQSTNTTLFEEQQLTFECSMAFKEVKYQRFQRQTYTPVYTPPKKKPKILARLPVGQSSSSASGKSFHSGPLILQLVSTLGIVLGSFIRPLFYL